MNHVDFLRLDNSRNGGYSQFTKVFHSKYRVISRNKEDLPLLKLPDSLIRIVENSQADLSYGGEPVTGALAGIRVYTHRTKIIVKVPDADKIGTEFFQEAMKIKYTLRSIDFASSKTKSLSSSTELEKGSIGLSVDISKLMSKESFGEVSAQYEAAFSKAFVFHVEQGKKYLLVNALKELIESYSTKLESLEVEVEGKLKKIPQRPVTVWMQIWMENINIILDDHFRLIEKRWGRE